MAGPRNNLQEMMAKLNGGGGVNSTSKTGGGSERAGPSSSRPAPTFTLARTASAGPSRSSAPTSTHPVPLHRSTPTLASSKSVPSMYKPPSKETLGSAILTPKSLNGSPPYRPNMARKDSNAEASSSARQEPTTSQKKASTLDSMPTERLLSMIVKNQAEQLELSKQKSRLGTNDDDWMGEDPEMIDAKMAMLEKRLAELYAAHTARSSAPKPQEHTSSGTTARSEYFAANVQPSAGPSSARYPTPSTASASSRMQAVTRNQPQQRSDNSMDGGRSLPVQNLVSDDEEEEIPLAKLKAFPSRSRVPPPPPDDYDIAMAEQEDLGGPSTPSNYHRGLAELEDVPLDALFSSPPPIPIPAPRTQQQPVRVSASATRSMQAGPSTSTQSKLTSGSLARSQALGGAGPSQRASSSSDEQAEPLQPEVTYPWSKEISQRLRQTFQLPRFRKHQKEAINATMEGKDVFVLMPTGGGKSLTYQLPAVCKKGTTQGVTFVISPLISLINDQTRHLLKLDVAALAYTGDMSAGDKAEAHKSLSEPDPWTKVVYVTPEMMAMGSQIKGIMRDLVRRKRLARFVIDEAHCVSQWGHDFRSDYLKLGDLRKEFPSVPIMALTATAQVKVQEDIIRSLGIKGCKVFHQSFNRPNLSYEVRKKGKDPLSDIVKVIYSQQVDRKHVPGIIYCASRDKCEILAMELREKHGLQAQHYHAGMSKGDRRRIQEGWQEHEFEIIVATVAFGMGIDKADVRFVIHHSIPRSLEGYYQETGRGGRDGKPSACILYFQYSDGKNMISMIQKDRVLTPEQKNRQIDSISEVIRFCMNNTDCRRAQVLSFFNEQFNPDKCHAGCDVCLCRDTKVYEVEDVTQDAQSVLKMMQGFGNDDHITIVSATEIWRGQSTKNTRNYAGNDYYGAGKDWERQDAERLIQWMIMEKALAEYTIVNGGGWSNSYLKLGLLSRDFLQNKRQIKLDFRIKSPVKVKMGVSRSKSTGSLATKRAAGQSNLNDYAIPTQRIVSNPLARKRSLQQIQAEEQAFDKSGWGDTDNEDEAGSVEDAPGYQKDSVDPIVMSGDEGDEPAPKKRKSIGTARKELVGDGAPASTAGKGKGKAKEGPDRSENRTPVEKCLQALKDVVQKEYEANTHAPKLPEYALQMLATTMPTNMVDLAIVEGVTSAHCKHYGTKILGATIKHLRLQEKANGITPGAYGSRLPPTATRARASTAKTTTVAAEGTPTQAPKATKAATTKKATTAPEPKQVVASIQSYAYKPTHGNTLPITVYASNAAGSGSGGASGSGTGEKRITLNPSGRGGAARPKF